MSALNDLRFCLFFSSLLIIELTSPGCASALRTGIAASEIAIRTTVRTEGKSFFIIAPVLKLKAPAGAPMENRESLDAPHGGLILEIIKHDHRMSTSYAMTLPDWSTFGR